MDNYTILVSNDIKRIAYNICHHNEKHLSEELHSETVLYITENNIDISTIPSEELPFYFSKVCWNIYHSTAKKGFKFKYNKIKYLKFQSPDIPSPEQDIEYAIAINAVEEELSKKKESASDEYYRTLYNAYLRYGSGREVAKVTKIPYRTVYQDLAVCKERLKLIYENSYKSR